MRDFNVVTLGEPDSGKTVFMAAMHEMLGNRAVDDSTHRVFVRAPMGTRSSLVKTYARIVNPDLDWDPGTDRKVYQEVPFTVVARGLDQTLADLFRVRYVDYSGERITTEWMDEKQRRFERHLREAHGVLVALDGAKVLSLLDRQELGRRYLYEDLKMVLGAVRETTARAPVHFMITKWDLFERRRLGLGFVKGELLKASDDLAGVVGSRLRSASPTATMRLIPVSSLGRDFVRPEPSEDGYLRMFKTSGRVRQLNVDVPLLSLLPDFYSQYMEELGAGGRTGFKRVLRRWHKRAGEVFPPVARAAGDVTAERLTEGKELESYVERILLKSLVDGLMSRFGRRPDRLDVRPEVVRGLPNNVQLAVQAAVQHMALRLEAFEQTYPESELTLADLDDLARTMEPE
ncbi:hypothetical protein AB0J52_24680 [Spirillospora sp. NPDC049652]